MFEAGRDAVWSVLQDPDALRQSIPGCEQLEKVAEDEYHATLKLGIAAIKGTYTAEVRLADKRPPESYRLIINGQGGPGFVQVDGVLQLQEEGTGTRVVYRFDVQVGGLIAAVGQRMLGGIAKMLMGEFFKGMQRQVATAS